tara:strand:+ start:410 stop:916 length:507 start_codon:yes stop_codon:yes gene_type:complete
MASLSNPILKFQKFIDNDQNNSYRSLQKITPGEAGLTDSDIQKYLLKFKKKTEDPIEKTVNSKDTEVKPITPKIDNTEKKYNYGQVLSHSETRELFKKISAIRKQHFLEKRHENIMNWYYDNRYSVNTLFKETMYDMINNEVEFTLSNKLLYNNFVEYCYDNYNKYHI